MIYDKPKSIGALAGIIISIFLIGQQAGIFIFLTNAMASLVRGNLGYIWVVDETTTNVNALSQLDMRKARELESIPGVKKAYPLVLAGGTAKFSNGKSSAITLIGVQAPRFAGGPWNLETGRKTDLLREGAIITEYFDRSTLGEAGIGDYFEVNGNKVFIAGNTRGVRSFGGVYTFTTIERARALGNFPLDKASAFLVERQADVTEEQVIALINRELKGIRAWNSEAFARATVNEVLASSGIAFSVGTLIIFALISGIIIIGLTLYSAAIDRIRDYGTLKAIGATNRFVRRLILTQAFLFALMGFSIAYLLILGFQNGIAQAGTFFEYPVWLKITFFIITLVIAFCGGMFAILRIVRLEPSEVFRG